MKILQLIWTLLIVVISFNAHANKLSDDGMYELRTVIESFSKSNNVKVLIDPRVTGRVSVFGDGIEKVSYGDLLTMLQVHDNTAYKSGGYIIVIPLALARQVAMPNTTEGVEYLPNEYVFDYIYLEKACPVELLLALRPILPPTSHLAPINNPRSIIVSGTYEKIELVRELIEKVESKLDKISDCGLAEKN